MSDFMHFDKYQKNQSVDFPQNMKEIIIIIDIITLFYLFFCDNTSIWQSYSQKKNNHILCILVSSKDTHGDLLM